MNVRGSRTLQLYRFFPLSSSPSVSIDSVWRLSRSSYHFSSVIVHVTNGLVVIINLELVDTNMCCSLHHHLGLFLALHCYRYVLCKFSRLPKKRSSHFEVPIASFEWWWWWWLLFLSRLNTTEISIMLNQFACVNVSKKLLIIIPICCVFPTRFFLPQSLNRCLNSTNEQNNPNKKFTILVRVSIDWWKKRINWKFTFQITAIISNEKEICEDYWYQKFSICCLRMKEIIQLICLLTWHLSNDENMWVVQSKYHWNLIENFLVKSA